MYREEFPKYWPKVGLDDKNRRELPRKILALGILGHYFHTVYNELRELAVALPEGGAGLSYAENKPQIDRLLVSFSFFKKFIIQNNDIVIDLFGKPKHSNANIRFYLSEDDQREQLILLYYFYRVKSGNNIQQMSSLIDQLSNDGTLQSKMCLKQRNQLHIMISRLQDVFQFLLAEARQKRAGHTGSESKPDGILRDCFFDINLNDTEQTDLIEEDSSRVSFVRRRMFGKGKEVGLNLQDELDEIGCYRDPSITCHLVVLSVYFVLCSVLGVAGFAFNIPALSWSAVGMFLCLFITHSLLSLSRSYFSNHTLKVDINDVFQKGLDRYLLIDLDAEIEEKVLADLIRHLNNEMVEGSKSRGYLWGGNAAEGRLLEAPYQIEEFRMLEMLRMFEKFSIAFGRPSSSVLRKHEGRESTQYQPDRHGVEVIQVMPDGVNNTLDMSDKQRSLVQCIYC